MKTIYKMFKSYLQALNNHKNNIMTGIYIALSILMVVAAVIGFIVQLNQNQ